MGMHHHTLGSHCLLCCRNFCSCVSVLISQFLDLGMQMAQQILVSFNFCILWWESYAMGSKNCGMYPSLLVFFWDLYAPGSTTLCCFMNIEQCVHVLFLLQWPLSVIDSHKDKVYWCLLVAFLLVLMQKFELLLIWWPLLSFRYYVLTGGEVTA